MCRLLFVLYECFEAVFQSTECVGFSHIRWYLQKLGSGHLSRVQLCIADDPRVLLDVNAGYVSACAQTGRNRTTSSKKVAGSAAMWVYRIDSFSDGFANARLASEVVKRLKQA